MDNVKIVNKPHELRQKQPFVRTGGGRRKKDITILKPNIDVNSHCASHDRANGSPHRHDAPVCRDGVDREGDFALFYSYIQSPPFSRLLFHLNSRRRAFSNTTPSRRKPKATMADEKSSPKGEPDKATSKVSHFRLVMSQGLVTPEVENHDYDGAGTEKDPFLVEFLENDPRDPMNWPDSKKWYITLTVAIATLAVSFVSSAYTGAIDQILKEFGCSQEVATLGVSLFVLGFAIGPLLWAPLSELYGRQVLFFGTYAVLTAFNAGAAGANSIASLLVMRFLAGTFGASPLTNAGGVIADMFPANQRGLGTALFAAAPFLGPVIGPIVGGFTGETVGWRWVEGVMAIFTGVLWIFGALFVPETYAPVILRRRAADLSKRTGHSYISIMEKQQGRTTVAAAFKKALARPWQLLFLEPIVMLISIYMAILYGTLYMLFGAFPIVYQQNRGWSQGIGGLAFLGVAIGMLIGVAYSVWDNKRYSEVEKKHGGEAPPEARLPPGMVGAVALPIGMFSCSITHFHHCRMTNNP